MNAVVNSAPAGATEIRSLDVLWQEAAAIGATRVRIESPGLMNFNGETIVSFIFSRGSDYACIEGTGVDVRLALEAGIRKARAFVAAMGAAR